MSSVTITPRKPRSPRNMPVTIVREKIAGVPGSMRAVVGRRHHHERHCAPGRPAANGCRYGSSTRGDGVGDPAGRVGVAGHPAETGEVLGGGVDPGVGLGRGRPRRRELDTRAGVRPYSRSRSPIGRVARCAGRDGVEHRREVEVDAGGGELAAPLRRSRPAATAVGDCALLRPRSGSSRSPARSGVARAALLVGRDEQAARVRAPDRCSRRVTVPGALDAPSELLPSRITDPAC